MSETPRVFARLRGHDLVPMGRIYVHSFGHDVFGNGAEAIEGARGHYKGILAQEAERFRQMDFLIGILWGLEGQKMADIFGYSGLGKDWQANPEVSNWVFRGGVYQPGHSISCGDGLIVLGREESARRTTGDKRHYLMNCGPQLGDSNLTIEHDEFRV